jgi:UPF0755 protein
MLSRKLYLLGSFILILAVASLVYLAHFAYQPRVFSPEQITYVLSPGATTHHIADDLHAQGLIQKPLLFRLLVRTEGQGKHLQSGEYHFTSGNTVQSFINKLVRGDVVRYEITLVDGWTFKQAFQVIENNPYLEHQLKGLTPAEVAQQLNLKHANPEGLFLPETYQFRRPNTDVEILQRAHQALLTVLNQAWSSRSSGDIYPTPYKALIAASLIQRESANDAERPEISGVIYRRLQKRMRLQIDPTVIYALGDKYRGKLHRKDMRINSPYNTYRHHGLPPTPIALPGKNAIIAATHPAMGDALYFVAMGDGRHYFSANLQQHDKAIKKYLLQKSNSAPDSSL